MYIPARNNMEKQWALHTSSGPPGIRRLVDLWPRSWSVSYILCSYADVLFYKQSCFARLMFEQKQKTF